MVNPYVATARWPVRRAVGALIGCWLVGPALLAAQHEPTQRDSSEAATLEPITVIGARAPSIAPPVETIEVPAEQLHRAPASGPYDMVRRTAGIEVHEQGQGPGFASDAVIRGFTSDHSSDVLLVVDGVPINLPLHGHVEGYADGACCPRLARFAPGDPRPVQPAVRGLRLRRGRRSHDGGRCRGQYRIPARLQLRRLRRVGPNRKAWSDIGGVLAVDGQRQQGWRENDDYWLGNVVAHGWRRAGAGRLTGGAMLYGSSWNSPGFVSVDRYNADDLEAATDPTDGGSAGRLILHGHYHVPTGDATTFESALWTQGVRSRVLLDIPHDDLVAQSEEEDSREAVGGDARLVWRPGTSEITAGMSGRADWVRYDLYDTEARVRDSHTQANDGRFTPVPHTCGGEGCWPSASPTTWVGASTWCTTPAWTNCRAVPTGGGDPTPGEPQAGGALTAERPRLPAGFFRARVPRCGRYHY